MSFTIPGVSLQEVYADRSLLVQLAAEFARVAGYEVGTRMDPDEPGWPVLLFELPTGQVSFRLTLEEFRGSFPSHYRMWDGHTEAQKRNRIRSFVHNRE